MKAIRLGYDYAHENFSCPLPMKRRGNGCGPTGTSSSMATPPPASAVYVRWRNCWRLVPDYAIYIADGCFPQFCSKYRVDPETGERTYCIIQAEDELAAIGMVLGAAWNGARSFTPTSGPAYR